MAQGNIKKRATTAAKKTKTQKKSSGARKGGNYFICKYSPHQNVGGNVSNYFRFSKIFTQLPLCTSKMLFLLVLFVWGIFNN
jgi:hypothetical protein